MDDEYVEIYEVPTIYADGIVDAEILGDTGNIRFTLFTWERGKKVAVCKIIRPISSYLVVDQIWAMIEKKQRDHSAASH